MPFKCVFRRSLLAAFSASCLLGCGGTAAQQEHLVIEFDRPLAQMRAQKRFGIFRNDKEDRKTQWIAESLERPAGANSESALKLHYEVPAADSFNGWWLKLEDEEWTAYRNYDLVLLLRLGENCTPTFKLELKARQGDDVQVYDTIVRISDSHVSAMQEHGFADVVIPMRDIVGEADISKMHELVLVFENTRLKPEHRQGDLYLRSIRIVPTDST